MISPDVGKELRRAEIRSALRDKLSPKETNTRTHRKFHSCLTLVEVNERVSTSWKSINDFTKCVLEELAEEGRRI